MSMSVPEHRITTTSILLVIVAAAALPRQVTAYEWQFSTAHDTGDTAGSYVSLALDSSGNPAVAYRLGQDVRYAGFDGADWQRHTAHRSASGYGARWITLGLDEADLPMLTFTDYKAWREMRVEYTWFNGGVWQPEYSYDLGIHSSLAVDSAGNTHLVLYQHTHQYDLLYRKYDGIDPVGTALRVDDDGGYDISATVDGSDVLHISHVTPSDRELRYARYNGSNWALDEQLALAGKARSTDIAVDDNGHLWISYFDADTSELECAHHNGNGWIFGSVDRRPGAWNGQTSIVLDDDGHPLIAYTRVDDGTPRLTLAHYDGTIWTYETAMTGGGYYASMAMDPLGLPVVAYRTGSAGSGYTIEIARAIPEPATIALLAVAAAGLVRPRR